MLNKRVVVGCLVAGIVVLSIVLPVLYTNTNSNVGTGRVIKYEAIIKVNKEPEDDPWDSWISDLTPDIGSRGFAGNRLGGASFASASFRFSVSIHPTLDFLTESRMVATFSFTSTVTARIVLESSDGGWPRLYIPQRTYSPGVQYRWVVVIPSYQSDNLFVSTFLIPRSATEHHYALPFVVECLYWSGGQGVYSSTGLSLSKSEHRLNHTHYLVIWSISFSDAWVGRQVSSCSVFTTDASAISDINSLLQQSNQRTITSGRLYYLIINNLNIVVQSGDKIEVWAYYVTTGNL